IAGIQGDTNRSVEAIAAIGETIMRISDIQANVAAAVEEQQVVSEQIGLTVQMASDELRELSAQSVGVRANATSVHEIAEQNRSRALALGDLHASLQRQLGPAGAGQAAGSPPPADTSIETTSNPAASLVAASSV
ncbi:MAG: hypothetical protein ACRBI6_12435, partial [Acidimicrobiales bacterium]